MRTLLLAATALIGVSAAHANPATATPPTGRYFLDTCASPTAPKDENTWTLGFDRVDGHAEFWPNGVANSAQWGYYTQLPYATTLTAVIGDPKALTNLAMVPVGDHARLTWVAGLKSGVMNCRVASISDTRPAVWHDATTAPPPAPGALYDPTKPTVSDPQVKPAAPAVAATLNSVPLTYDNMGAKVAVSLGTMPVTMVIDTGAQTMTVTQTVADWLVSNGQATANATGDKFILAGGDQKEFKSVEINTVNLAGHEIHKVHANVVQDGGTMLLGLPILAQLAPKISFDFPNAKLTFL